MLNFFFISVRKISTSKRVRRFFYNNKCHLVGTLEKSLCHFFQKREKKMYANKPFERNRLRSFIGNFETNSYGNLKYSPNEWLYITLGKQKKKNVQNVSYNFEPYIIINYKLLGIQFKKEVSFELKALNFNTMSNVL